jgi:hypothetical protein
VVPRVVDLGKNIAVAVIGIRHACSLATMAPKTSRAAVRIV